MRNICGPSRTFAKSPYIEGKLLTDALNVSIIIEQSRQDLTFHNFVRKRENYVDLQQKHMACGCKLEQKYISFIKVSCLTTLIFNVFTSTYLPLPLFLKIPSAICTNKAHLLSLGSSSETLVIIAKAFLNEPNCDTNEILANYKYFS